MKVVGQYTEEFNNLSGQKLPVGDVLQADGLQKHVENHHPEDIGIINDIPNIIAAPDYVGHNPKEANSIELIKVTSSNKKVCIKLDSKNGYLYVASAYTMTDAKLNKHIALGRLVKYKP